MSESFVLGLRRTNLIVGFGADFGRARDAVGRMARFVEQCGYRVLRSDVGRWMTAVTISLDPYLDEEEFCSQIKSMIEGDGNLKYLAMRVESKYEIGAAT